jgi:hypothetical protein
MNGHTYERTWSKKHGQFPYPSFKAPREETGVAEILSAGRSGTKCTNVPVLPLYFVVPMESTNQPRYYLGGRPAMNGTQSEG